MSHKLTSVVLQLTTPCCSHCDSCSSVGDLHTIWRRTGRLFQGMANHGHLLMRCLWNGESRMVEVPVGPNLESFTVSNPSQPITFLSFGANCRLIGPSVAHQTSSWPWMTMASRSFRSMNETFCCPSGSPRPRALALLAPSDIRPFLPGLCHNLRVYRASFLCLFLRHKYFLRLHKS